MARKKRTTQDPIVKTFAANLRRARNKTKMSQQALALKASVTTSYVGKIERAESAPGLDMVARLAKAVGADPRDLIAEGPSEDRSMSVARQELQRHVKRLISREDAHAVQAASIVVGLMDNALARQNR